MADEKFINEAIQYITELFKDNSDGHDLQHSMRVYRNAMAICDAYPAADREIVAVAALLHDADDHKLFGTFNNENAREFLESHGFEADKIEEICEIINAVSFSKNKGLTPETIEGCIVQDADRLDALGAIGIARTFAYGGRHGRSMEESIEHFYEKLLLLRDEMNTPEAKARADERHAFIEQYIEELRQELYSQRPEQTIADTGNENEKL